MSTVKSSKSLLLTEEEAMALLDMCLTSQADNDPLKESAMMKVTDLVRRFIAEEQAEREELPHASEIYSPEWEEHGSPCRLDRFGRGLERTRLPGNASLSRVAPILHR